MKPATIVSTPQKGGLTRWCIVSIAAIGFLFDIYELMMTPLIAAPAIAELLKTPQSDPVITDWIGRLLWISALNGGVFGLLGGWLVDTFGRKKMMAASIFLYAFSPFFAAYSTSLASFILFRSMTFIGVCVEFVAAVTWLSEVFDDKKQRARWLGITQTFSSLGGVLVTVMSMAVHAGIENLPHLGLPVGPGAAGPGEWRYLLMTGLLPAILIALLLPFVPESQVWQERRTIGALKRPSFGDLFTPELRRITIVTALLSACAYGIAFGALNVTIARVASGFPDMKPQAAQLASLRSEADALTRQFNALPAGKLSREEIAVRIKENVTKQNQINSAVKKLRNKLQFFQEMGGLAGRILLACFLIVGISRVTLLRIFQIPALIILPLTYFLFFKQGSETFLWIYAICGLLTVAQFSYFGEYLPKVFPLHLRGTGGSFATNVGGRMVGTGMAFVTTSIVAPMLSGPDPLLPAHVAQAAGIVATVIAVIAFFIGFLLPEPT